MARGIEKVAEKFAVETFVYWGNPVDDGYGGFTFDAPVEMKCRWENKREIMLDQAGREFTCNASLLLVDIDVELEGRCYRGTIQELVDAGEDINKPVGIKEVYMVRRFDRIPMVRKNDEFVRTAYLFYYGK